MFRASSWESSPSFAAARLTIAVPMINRMPRQHASMIVGEMIVRDLRDVMAYISTALKNKDERGMYINAVSVKTDVLRTDFKVLHSVSKITTCHFFTDGQYAEVIDLLVEIENNRSRWAKATAEMAAKRK